MGQIRVIGYHGTAEENISSILQDGFKAKIRNDHWLGQGIYFYTTFDLAQWWIKRKAAKFAYQGYGVVEAHLGCEEHEFLDLDLPSHVDYLLKEAKKILGEEVNGQVTFEEDEKSRKKNFCYLVDLVKGVRGIKIIARTFRSQSPNPTYATENISDFEKQFFPLPLDFEYQEKQICASSNEVILAKTNVTPSL